jgi:hypothetical protein
MSCSPQLLQTLAPGSLYASQRRHTSPKAADEACSSAGAASSAGASSRKGALQRRHSTAVSSFSFPQAGQVIMAAS